jgi:hypothetical protein
MIGTDFDQFIFGILYNAMLAHFHILYQYLTALLPQLSEAFHGFIFWQLWMKGN